MSPDVSTVMHNWSEKSQLGRKTATNTTQRQIGSSNSGARVKLKHLYKTFLDD
jgi:hypothetical protein